MIYTRLNIPLLAVVSGLVISGCATTKAEPYIVDFTDDKVKVAVAFNILGPPSDDARSASASLAKNQCATYDKTSELVSGFRRRIGNYHTGVYEFLYRCLGADTVRIEDD